jgi:hypothetical protein
MQVLQPQKRCPLNDDSSAAASSSSPDSPRAHITGPGLRILADGHKFRVFKQTILVPMETAALKRGQYVYDFPIKHLNDSHVDIPYATAQLLARGFLVNSTKEGLTVSLPR